MDFLEYYGILENSKWKSLLILVFCLNIFVKYLKHIWKKQAVESCLNLRTVLFLCILQFFEPVILEFRMICHVGQWSSIDAIKEEA